VRALTDAVLYCSTHTGSDMAQTAQKILAVHLSKDAILSKMCRVAVYEISGLAGAALVGRVPGLFQRGTFSHQARSASKAYFSSVRGLP